MVPVGPFNRKLTLHNNTSSPPALPPQPARTLYPLSPATPLPSRHLSLVNNRATGGVSPSVIATTSQAMVVAPTTMTKTTTTTAATSTPTAPTSSGQQWIQSKGKNLSLMSPASYKKAMEARDKSIRSSKEKKLKLHQARAKMASDLRRGIVTVGGTEYSKSRDGRKLVMRDTSKDNVVINGVLFEMDPRGNKLVRKASSNSTTSVPTTMTSSAKVNAVRSAIRDEIPSPGSGLKGSTPKQFSMDGIVYVRTRSGNLVRASLVKDQLLERR